MESSSKTEREKMLSGESYKFNDEELTQRRNKTFNGCTMFNATGDTKYLYEIFENFPVSSRINPPFHCDYAENIKLGENVLINFNSSVLSCAMVEIGDNCYIGPNTQIYTAIHPITLIERDKGIGTAKPVKIGKSCWFGGGVIVLPGVEIGDGTTIGAGSVVTKNIPANCVAAGNPCKVIRYLDSDNKSLEIEHVQN